MNVTLAPDLEKFVQEKVEAGPTRMKRPKVTPRAKLDLFAIWEYIANDSIAAADKAVAKIKYEFGKLAEMP